MFRTNVRLQNFVRICPKTLKLYWLQHFRPLSALLYTESRNKLYCTYPEPPAKGSAPPKEDEKKEEGPGNPAKESANNPLEKPPGTLGPKMEDWCVKQRMQKLYYIQLLQQSIRPFYLQTPFFAFLCILASEIRSMPQGNNYL